MAKETRLIDPARKLLMDNTVGRDFAQGREVPIAVPVSTAPDRQVDELGKPAGL